MKDWNATGLIDTTVASLTILCSFVFRTSLMLSSFFHHFSGISLSFFPPFLSNFNCSLYNFLVGSQPERITLELYNVKCQSRDLSQQKNKVGISPVRGFGNLHLNFHLFLAFYSVKKLKLPLPHRICFSKGVINQVFICLNAFIWCFYCKAILKSSTLIWMAQF